MGKPGKPLVDEIAERLPDLVDDFFASGRKGASISIELLLEFTDGDKAIQAVELIIVQELYAQLMKGLSFIMSNSTEGLEDVNILLSKYCHLWKEK